MFCFLFFLSSFIFSLSPQIELPSIGKQFIFFSSKQTLPTTFTVIPQSHPIQKDSWNAFFSNQDAQKFYQSLPFLPYSEEVKLMTLLTDSPHLLDFKPSFHSCIIIDLSESTLYKFSFSLPPKPYQHHALSLYGALDYEPIRFYKLRTFLKISDPKIPQLSHSVLFLEKNALF